MAESMAAWKVSGKWTCRTQAQLQTNECASGSIVVGPTAWCFGHPVVKQSPLRESNVCRTEEGQLVVIQNEDSAPLREITPSAQVGRLSGSHSDVGFQLTKFPGEKEWRNGKVKSPII